MKIPFLGAAMLCLSLLAPAASGQALKPDQPGDAAAYVDGRLTGRNPEGTWSLFTEGKMETGKGFVRNPKLWCADLDLTCFSPWNSTEHNLQGGTLITRRHVLLANHFSNPYTGTPPMVPGSTTMVFVAQDNTPYVRKIVKFTQVAKTDVLIGTLDSDLPDKITPAQIFPAARGKGIPAGTPLIYMDQEKRANLGECVIGVGPSIILQPATGAVRVPWAKAYVARVGDSGSPIFLPLHGKAILVAHFFMANGGPNTGLYVDEINAITGKGYPVQEATLVSAEKPAAGR